MLQHKLSTAAHLHTLPERLLKDQRAFTGCYTLQDPQCLQNHSLWREALFWHVVFRCEKVSDLSLFKVFSEAFHSLLVQGFSTVSTPL